MRALASAIIDGHALLELIYVAAVAGVGFCVVYALGVIGITRSQERRRARRTGAAALYAGLALVALAACAWAVVTGVEIMATK